MVTGRYCARLANAAKCISAADLRVKPALQMTSPVAMTTRRALRDVFVATNAARKNKMNGAHV